MIIARVCRFSFIDDWLDSWKHVCSSWRDRRWRWSDLICCSTATIPSLVLLGSFLFTLSVVLFARAPFSNWRCCAVRAAFIAKIQYCCDSTLDLLRSLKLISSRNRLSAGTSSGTSFFLSWHSWISAYLYSGPAEARVLFWSPDFVHVGLSFHCQF